jgi:amidase
VNIPGATVDCAPVGLSIIGGRGTDLDLMRVAVALES